MDVLLSFLEDCPPLPRQKQKKQTNEKLEKVFAIHTIDDGTISLLNVAHLYQSINSNNPVEENK